MLSRRARAVVVMTMVVMATAMTVSAESRRVVVVGAQPRLVEAIALALSPWGLEVVGVTPDRSAATLQDALARASGLAAEHHAAVVLGIAREGTRASLWVYEESTAQVSVRPLGASPPFDDATAASVALSVKTLLRSTAIAPADARSQPSSSASTASSSAATAPPSSASPTATSQRALEATAPTATGTAPSSAAAPPAAQLEAHAIRAEVLIGARFGTGATDPVEPRLGFGASYWPRAADGRLGVALTAISGIGVALDRPWFSGRYSDHAVGLAARGRLLLTPWLAGEVSAGSALHFVSIYGERLVQGGHASVLRVDPGLEGGLLFDFLIAPRFSVGAHVDATLLLRYQRYVVSGAPVLDSPPVGISAGTRLSIALD